MNMTRQAIRIPVGTSVWTAALLLAPAALAGGPSGKAPEEAKKDRAESGTRREEETCREAEHVSRV
jgi:hypothetical protein